ncbi:MAG: energy-converting hydrogenase B subunit G, EhbG [Methanobacteriaceae archaeon]|nr:energy-converting hydrogenase B subunit G, EhbG [Methanobacteriaceae archaeon]
MNMYDQFVEKLKNTFTHDAESGIVSGVETSSLLAAELVLMASVIIAAMTIRFVSPYLMLIVVVALLLLFTYTTPLMTKLYKEHSDSLSNMTFYVVMTLAILAIIFYWGQL